jgi:branched-chain amino acid transport system substrate-binding protein
MKTKVSSNTLLIILILHLTVAIMLSLFGDGVLAAEKEPIKVGILTDLTGPSSSFVIPIDVWGFGGYLEDINSRGGIKGHKIEVTTLDAAYKMDTIITGYGQLLSQKVLVIEACSAPFTIGLKSRFAKDKMVVLTPNAPTEPFWPPGWIYGHMVTIADSAGFIVDRIIEGLEAQKRDLRKQPPKIAWIYPDNPFGRTVLPGIPYAEARGCITAISAGVDMMPTNTSSTLRRIKDSGADAIFIHHIAAPVSVVLKDALRVGIDIPFYGDQGSAAESVIAYSGLLSDGFFPETPLEVHCKECPGTKRMIDHIKKKHPGGIIELSQFAQGWIHGIILEAALERTIEKKGWPITSEDIKNTLDEIKDLDVGGLQAPISYYKGMDNRGTDVSKLRKIIKKQKGLGTEFLVEPQTNFIPAPIVLPKGLEAQNPGLKEFCKKRGLTYFSPESGIIMPK